MKVLKKAILIVFLISVITHLPAREKPFEDEIKRFKEMDLQAMPPQNAILFVGSSTFRKWENMQSYFPGYNIINRGFGGSTFPDIIAYENDIIFPYHPRQIVIYCGDNDLAYSQIVTPQLVFRRFTQLFSFIRRRLPNTSIAYISIKPSPSRKKMWAKMNVANNMIRTFLNRNENTAFIDVFNKMLLSDGELRSELFSEDQLHLNKKGYALLQQSIQPYLIK